MPAVVSFAVIYPRHLVSKAINSAVLKCPLLRIISELENFNQL